MEPVKVFLDTNVVLDYYTGRMGNDEAKKIVLSGQDPQIELCISILTAINVLYVSAKYAPSLSPADISALFHVLTMDYQQYCDAQSLKISDFEDALQLACASRNGCKAIVSRDKELLECSISTPLILSPELYLRKIEVEL